MLSYRDFRCAYDGLKFYENEFLIPELNEGTTASKIRARELPRSRGGTVIVRNGGWHFTCLGGVEAVAKKIASFAHQEYNPGEDKIDLGEINRIVESGGGVFWKMNCFGERIDESFPRFIRENQARYTHLIFNVTRAYEKRVRLARCARTLQGRFDLRPPCRSHGRNGRGRHVVERRLYATHQRECVGHHVRLQGDVQD